MTQSVAITENINAIPYFKHTEHPDWLGKWTAGRINVKTYDYFTLNGEPIVYEASCTFTFTGTDPTKNGVAVTDHEEIILKAKQTTLHGPVLCNGDTKTGKSKPGNQLQVKSKHHLTTD